MACRLRQRMERNAFKRLKVLSWKEGLLENVSYYSMQFIRTFLITDVFHSFLRR